MKVRRHCFSHLPCLLHQFGDLHMTLVFPSLVRRTVTYRLKSQISVQNPTKMSFNKLAIDALDLAGKRVLMR